MINFFKDELCDKKIAFFNFYEEQRIEMKDDELFPYDLTVIDPYQLNQDMKMKNNLYYTIMKKTSGIFLFKQRPRTEEIRRSCVQDDFINTCHQLGVYVDKKNYKDVLVHSEINESIKMIQYYKTIQNTGLLLKHIIVRKFKGGTEWYLRNMKEGVFIYLATVKETQKYHRR